ncbi:MAG: hypothetical protein GX070_13045 [Alcaligenaceae bacterium]|nr:hypothetical protein [Alcaligenaceae bacterium]
MPSQTRISATYMRGGTGKGIYFLAQDLPRAPLPNFVPVSVLVQEAVQA